MGRSKFFHFEGGSQYSYKVNYMSVAYNDNRGPDRAICTKGTINMKTHIENMINDGDWFYCDLLALLLGGGFVSYNMYKCYMLSS